MIDQLLERWHQIEPTQCGFTDNCFIIRLPDGSHFEWDLTSKYNDESLLEQAVRFAIHKHKVQIYSVDIPEEDYKYRVSIIRSRFEGYSAGIKDSAAEAILSSYITFLQANQANEQQAARVFQPSKSYA